MQLLSLSVLSGIFVYCVMTLLLTSNGTMLVKGRLEKYFQDADAEEVQDLVLKESHENARKKKLKKIQLVGKDFSNDLAASGVKLSAAEYISAWALSTLLPMLAVLFLSGGIITALGIGIIGFSAPPFFVQRSRRKRQEEFNRQLGESLTIMGNCIKAGFTFQQAMESIAAEMQPPISSEFSKTLREVHYGISLEDALKHMVERVKNKDLDLLVSAVLTSAQVGGNLSDILEVISETVKDRIKIKAEVRVLTSSGRTSGIIIGMLPIFIIIALMVINPDYFRSFFETGAGKVMLIVSAILETTGFLVINKIVDIKY